MVNHTAVFFDPWAVPGCGWAPQTSSTHTKKKKRGKHATGVTRTRNKDRKVVTTNIAQWWLSLSSRSISCQVFALRDSSPVGWERPCSRELDWISMWLHFYGQSWSQVVLEGVPQPGASCGFSDASDVFLKQNCKHESRKQADLHAAHANYRLVVFPSQAPIFSHKEKKCLWYKFLSSKEPIWGVGKNLQMSFELSSGKTIIYKSTIPGFDHNPVTFYPQIISKF